MAAALALLSACGGGGGGSSDARCPTTDPVPAVNGAVTVCAFDIRFDVKTITTPAGPLKVTLINEGSQPHTFKVDGTGFELSTPAKGDERTGTVTLEANKTYVFKCTYDGHDAAGMHGKIVVS